MSALEQKLRRNIDIVLKLTIILCAFAASASAGYYYLVLLPRRDAQLVLERRLERAGTEALRREEGARAEAARSAERERILSERRAMEEEREAARKAAAQRQYQSCLERAQEGYATSWAAACKRIAAQASKDYTECISSMALSKEVCAKTYPDHVVSATCALPPSVKADLTANVTKAREACVQESKAAVP